MSKLKPCPFCGGEAELICVPGYYQSELSSPGWLVKCKNGCCNQMPYSSDHDAVEAWNRRAEQQFIPCSPETMPKKTGYYLVQYTRKYCRNEMAVAFYSVEEARCDDDYTWEIETFSDIKEVIAWRPMPEPYREEGEADDSN